MQLYIIVPLNFRNIVKYGFIFVLPTALLPCTWNQPIWWCSLCWISWASKVVYVSYYVYITIHSVDFGIRKTKQHRTKQTNEKKKRVQLQQEKQTTFELTWRSFCHKKISIVYPVQRTDFAYFVVKCDVFLPCSAKCDVVQVIVTKW